MKISARPGDPDYNDQAPLGRWAVMLDGKAVPKAFFADDEAGEVRAYATNADGSIKLTASRDDAEVVTLRGKVEIIDQWAGTP